MQPHSSNTSSLSAPLVLIEWHDAMGCADSWTPLKDCTPVVVICKSVGWLLHDGEECKVIVPHISAENYHATTQGCGDMNIPTSAVRRMVVLRESTNGD